MLEIFSPFNPSVRQFVARLLSLTYPGVGLFGRSPTYTYTHMGLGREREMGWKECMDMWGVWRLLGCHIVTWSEGN